MEQIQMINDSPQCQSYYLHRETMLQRKQQYFKTILQQLDLSNNNDENEIGQRFIVDSTNQQLELPNSLDLKFATSIPKKIDEQIRYVILNETIDAQNFDYEVLQHQCQPEYNIQTEFLWEDDVERIDQVYNYLQKCIHEEQDVVIYCQDINELESFKEIFQQLGNIQIRLNPEFNELYSQIDVRKQQNQNHTIFLLLEPQYLDSEYITLIIHTQFKQYHTQYINNSVSYQTQLLSKQELIIREIPKSNLVGVKIIYNFPEEVYLKLPAKIQINESIQTEFYNLQEKTKHSIIIKGVLDTPGTLLQRNKNISLTIRTSNLWSSKGDAYSWIEIIEYLGQQLSSIILNSQIDKNQSTFELVQLEKWCQDNVISMLKGIIVLLYVKQYASQYNLPHIDVLSEFNLQPIRRSSSMQIAQEDKPQVEEQLKQNFPVAELKQDRLYHIGDQSFELDSFCIQKQKGRLQTHILVLAIRNNKILYLHNKNRKQSIAQKEIVLNNVGNAILEELWKNEGIEIITLENKLNCTIEPNPDLNLITIYSDDQLDISELNARIEQIKVNLKTQIMEIKHQSGKKLIFQSGAVITEWIKEHESKDFQIHNLPPNTTEADIKELFDDFTNITHLKLNYLPNETQAYIVIEDKDDLPYIIQAYDQSEVQDRLISIITDKKQNEVKKNIQQKYQIKIIWYAKLCVDSCILITHNKEHAEQCQKQFDNQMLDGRKIKVTQIDEVTLKFSNLSPLTTEYDILMLCGGKQKVKFVDIQSKMLPESKEDYSSKILSLINSQLDNRERRALLHHSQIIRKQGGKRQLIVNIENQHVMQKLLEQLNNNSISIGANFIKVHLKPIYKQTHKIQHRLKSYIMSLLKFDDLKFKVNFEEIKGAKQSELTMIVQTYNILVHQQLDQFITNKLSGQQIEVTNNSDFLFTPFGLKKLKELELQIDNIVFMIDQMKKVIRVCCEESKIQEIKKLVNEITQSVVTHKLHISPGSLKELVGVKGQGLESLKKQFNLTQIKYKQQGKELFLEGPGQSIQEAVACIESAIGQVYQDDQQSLNQANCPICFDSMKHSYLIQGCGHKCCKECISLHCQGVLQDMKLLPVRCPICNEKMLLNDVIPLIGQENMKNLQDLSINKFVQENIKTLSFCFTPACNNFEEIEQNNVLSCTVCEKSYCLLCKSLRHPGMTCEEFKIGDQVLLQKLMKEQDIRKCPSCQALIQRIDGCYRVTCSVCKKSICWKNDKTGKPCMLVFNTASECYDHLTKMHNGYW